MKCPLLDTRGFTSPDLELPEDDLLPRKQALFSARGLGLTHFLRAGGVPSRLHGALRVLLMDEEELETYCGDPRRDKVKLDVTFRSDQGIFVKSLEIGQR